MCRLLEDCISTFARLSSKNVPVLWLLLSRGSCLIQVAMFSVQGDRSKSRTAIIIKLPGGVSLSIHAIFAHGQGNETA